MISYIFYFSLLHFMNGGHVWNFNSETIVEHKIQDAKFAESDVGYGLICNSKCMPLSR